MPSNVSGYHSRMNFEVEATTSSDTQDASLRVLGGEYSTAHTATPDFGRLTSRTAGIEMA